MTERESAGKKGVSLMGVAAAADHVRDGVFARLSLGNVFVIGDVPDHPLQTLRMSALRKSFFHQTLAGLLAGDTTGAGQSHEHFCL